MNLLKKISKSSSDVEQLLQKIFESEVDGDCGRDGSPTNLAGELERGASDGDQQPQQQPQANQPQADQPPAQPTEGWLETESGPVQFFIDDLGRMWTGGPTPGGGERWSRHKAGDRGPSGRENAGDSQ